MLQQGIVGLKDVTEPATCTALASCCSELPCSIHILQTGEEHFLTHRVAINAIKWSIWTTVSSHLPPTCTVGLTTARWQGTKTTFTALYHLQHPVCCFTVCSAIFLLSQIKASNKDHQVPASTTWTAGWMAPQVSRVGMGWRLVRWSLTPPSERCAHAQPPQGQHLPELWHGDCEVEELCI